MSKKKSTVNSIIKEIDKSYNIKKFFKENEIKIKKKFFKKNILLLGAAGTIGNAILKKISIYSYQSLILVDSNENQLIDTYRDILRNKKINSKIIEYYPIDIVSPDIISIIKKHRINLIINCAASKHVRSQKNLIRNRRIFFNNFFINFYVLNYLTKIDQKIIYFSVSTDKSSDPKNLMGLTKNLMENCLIYFNNNYKNISCFSARFANVFLSQGSYLNYINKNNSSKNIFIPQNVSRYFISDNTASELSLISLLYPGKIICPDESEIKSLNLDLLIRKLIIKNSRSRMSKTNIDSSIEKNNEQFIDKNETFIKKNLIYIISKNVIDSSFNNSIGKIINKTLNFEKIKNDCFSYFYRKYSKKFSQNLELHLDNNP